MLKLNLLKRILQASEKELRKIVVAELEKLESYYVTLHDEFIFAEQKSKDTFIPAMLVAHMDTAHRNLPDELFFDANANVFFSPKGLGADDRAGVFAALMLAKRHKVSCLFTHGEESGGIGAKAFIDKFPSNTSGFKMLLQLDRRGQNDAVFYSNNAEDFQQYILDAGFTKAHGSFSDISFIAPAWQINSVNLSVGYENEHTKHEILYLNHLNETIMKVSAILLNQIPEFAYSAYSYSYGFGNHCGYDDAGWGYYWGNRAPGKWDSKWDKREKPNLPLTKPLEQDLGECFFCGEGVELDFMQANGCDEDLESGQWESIPFCTDCWEEFEGYYCLECGKIAYRSFAEYDSAADMDVCDDCYCELIIAEASRE